MEREYRTTYKSKIGNIIMSSDGENLTGLWFSTSRFKEEHEAKKYEIKEDLLVFKQTKNWLNKYFDGLRPNPKELSLKLTGTNFCLDVWNIIKKIPYGQTITYGTIAKKIGEKYNQKMSAQAVGYAVGHNPISIIIPCHRVIGSKGNLTGYGGGINTKIALLKHEKVDINKLYIPKKRKAL